MRSFKTWILLAAAAMIAGPSQAAELKVGDDAPDFKLMGSDGKEYTLSQFKGKSGVVLNFFPKAFTPG
jgi:peroxiredoxin Q/BCP